MTRGSTRWLPLVLTVLLVIGALPAVAAGAQRAGGAVVVDEGETVAELTATGGTVVVRGTVTGDLQAYAGSVVIAEGGSVGGQVTAYAGSVSIAGTVGGDAVSTGGSVTLEETGEVGGTLVVAAGSATVAGTVGGDLIAGAGSLRLASTAVVRGDLTYDAALTDDGAEIRGDVRRSEDLDVGPFAPQPVALSVAFAVYRFLVDLVLGVALLLALPGFSRGVADRVETAPLRSGLVGIAAVILVPVGLLLLAVTIVGIPFALAGGLLFALVLWVGSVYGRFAVGRWLLSLGEVDHRWWALVLGLVVVAVAARIPFVGGLVRGVVVVLGLGALSLVIRDRVREFYGPDEPEDDMQRL